MDKQKIKAPFIERLFWWVPSSGGGGGEGQGNGGGNSSNHDDDFVPPSEPTSFKSYSQSSPKLNDIDNILQRAEKKTWHHHLEEDKINNFKTTTDKVHFETFSSVINFRDTILRRKANRTFKYKQSSTKENVGGWSGTSTFDEAVRMLVEGDMRLVAKLENISKSIDIPKTKYIPKKRLTSNVHGFIPIVPHVLNCIPNSMICSERVSRQTKAISIYLNIAVPCVVSADEIIKASVMLFEAIEILERNNIDIELFIMDVVKTNPYIHEPGEFFGFCIKLKDFGQRINRTRLSFALMNPAMSRRLGFRWTETFNNPCPPESMSEGYGCCIEPQPLIDRIKKSGGIPLNLKELVRKCFSVDDVIKLIKRKL